MWCKYCVRLGGVVLIVLPAERSGNTYFEFPWADTLRLVSCQTVTLFFTRVFHDTFDTGDVESEIIFSAEQLNMVRPGS